MMGASGMGNVDRREILLRIVLVTSVIFLCVLSAIVMANHGHFTFSFDDPYIHLAMAEEILRGHYGINPAEPAAAASSILYPFLLAPFLALGLGQYAALLINFLGLLAIGAVAAMILDDLRLPLARLPRLTLAIAVSILASGVISLAFSGLEHVLQVASVLLCLWGLMRFLETGRVPVWFVLALIVAPLIRYEGMAILAAGILVLVLRRAWKSAFIAALIGFGLVAGFSAFLMHLGLSALPSSVLVKSGESMGGVSADVAGLAGVLMRRMGETIQDPRGMLLLLGVVFSGVPFLKAAHRTSHPSDWPPSALIGLFCALIGFAHLALGAYGWFARYEIYALLLLIFGLVAIHADALRPCLARASAWQVTWVSLGFFLLMIRMIAMVPASVTAAQNIYEQQYQMHRFVTEVWKAPVAVNDLGWVSFENDLYVLDLFGLGSGQARKMRAAHPRSGEWMGPMARDADVKLAMIFPEWLNYIPCHWVRLGTLNLASRAVSVPVDHVTFYATDASDAEFILSKIRRFESTLPDGVIFQFADLSVMPRHNAFCAD